MSYVSSVLQPGETIKAVGKLHWIIFARAIALAVVGVVVLIYSTTLSMQTARLVQWIGWGALVLAAFACLQAWFVRWITELAVTNHRVIYKRGFLWRHTVEMNMDKVETIDVDQSILGRLLGFGTIRVRGTGQGIEDLARIASPLELRSAITTR